MMPQFKKEQYRPNDRAVSDLPTVMIIFGASGDLMSRKLIPAIYNLKLDNLLPRSFHLIGFGRKKLSESVFKDELKSAIKNHSRRNFDSSVWKEIADYTYYNNGDYETIDGFYDLSKKVNQVKEKLGSKVQVVFYLSTPPSVFGSIIKYLGTVGLAHEYDSKIVIEKPFGRDLESALALNKKISEVFDEKQVYRIDHYLGKETVQDLLLQRFANTIFEPIWNRRYIECVQLTLAEEIGVGTRGGYYDKSGALRDMVQNHMMQLLSLVAMETPVSFDPQSIRDEKVKLLRAIKPINRDPREGDAVRARYKEGYVDGKQPTLGYLQEEGIAPSSTIETYTALRLKIDNWRWKGVPFYLRSGKRLAHRVSEIAIQFKRPPDILFPDDGPFRISSNELVMRIQPKEHLTLLINSKRPGLETFTQPVKMNYDYADTFDTNPPEAYERLILDALIGDSTLFIRNDEAEASWKIFSPLLEFWQEAGADGLEHYTAHSWGPEAAKRLVQENGHEWRVPF